MLHRKWKTELRKRELLMLLKKAHAEPEEIPTRRTPELKARNRDAYAKRRASYLMHSRKVFERDGWVCARCGKPIVDKNNARAYDMLFKYGSLVFDMSTYVTLCRSCYDRTSLQYDGEICNCVRKRASKKFSCGTCMKPPTLEERIRLKVGEGMTRWLNLEI